jgi:hypothetical protein
MKIVTVETRNGGDEVFEEGIDRVIVEASNGVKFVITEDNGKLCIESSEKYMTVTPFDTNVIGVE